ncbi:MAG: hypothetical protein ACKVWR_20705 [Acidimicrobiales bacterium]
MRRAPHRVLLALGLALACASLAACTVPVGGGGVDATSPPGPTGPYTMDPYRGLGTWVDVYEWSMTMGGPRPSVGLWDIDAMAAEGVRTVYLQTARYTADDDVLEQPWLSMLVRRAHERGMKVVGWYLPTFEDLDKDLRRLLAMRNMGVDGVAVDIESTRVRDEAERARRLVELSRRLREAIPRPEVISAVVLPPVALELGTGYWDIHPWAEIAPYYDVWLPMDYWSVRRADSGYRDGHRYTADNIDQLRGLIGQPSAPVHPIGGIADNVTTTDVEGFVRAARERGALGVSLYNFSTTPPAYWPILRSY